MDISKEITRIINIANTHLTEMNLFANNPNIGRLGYGGIKEVKEELENLIKEIKNDNNVKVDQDLRDLINAESDYYEGSPLYKEDGKTESS